MQAQCIITGQTQARGDVCSRVHMLKPFQECLTAQRSLQAIQTLLRAGLGRITYLRYAPTSHRVLQHVLKNLCHRNLLPADNFSESKLSAKLMCCERPRT